jgi:hypothetical protein
VQHYQTHFDYQSKQARNVRLAQLLSRQHFKIDKHEHIRKIERELLLPFPLDEGTA